jgi:hypothetical protein
MKSGRRTLPWERGLDFIDSKEMQGQETFLMSKLEFIASQKVCTHKYCWSCIIVDVDIHSLDQNDLCEEEMCLALYYPLYSISRGREKPSLTVKNDFQG